MYILLFFFTLAFLCMGGSLLFLNTKGQFLYIKVSRYCD